MVQLFQDRQARLQEPGGALLRMLARERSGGGRGRWAPLSFCFRGRVLGYRRWGLDGGWEREIPVPIPRPAPPPSPFFSPPLSDSATLVSLDPSLIPPISLTLTHLFGMLRLDETVLILLTTTRIPVR